MSHEVVAASGRPFAADEACPVCEHGRLELLQRQETFEYRGRHLTVPVERFECSACLETFVDDAAADAVEPTLSRWRKEVDGA